MWLKFHQNRRYLIFQGGWGQKPPITFRGAYNNKKKAEIMGI